MFNGGAILPFDFVLPNELLVTIGTKAMDWLFGDAVDVAFDWLLRDSIERKLLRLVAERLDVTINVFEAELAPWVARTVAIPTGDGTVKVIGKQSLRGCCHCSRSSGSLPLNFIVTIELGANPAPEISTDEPTGPEAGSSKMTGFTKAVTVNVFEAELDP